MCINVLEGVVSELEGGVEDVNPQDFFLPPLSFHIGLRYISAVFSEW